MSLGQKMKIIKTCFPLKSIEKILKAEERSIVLYKGVTAYGYHRDKTWDIKEANKK